MKSIKVKDAVDFLNPHISIDNLLLIAYLIFMSFILVLQISTSTKLNPDNFVRNSILCVIGLWTLSFCIYFNVFEYIFYRMET